MQFFLHSIGLLAALAFGEAVELRRDETVCRTKINYRNP